MSATVTLYVCFNIFLMESYCTLSFVTWFLHSLGGNVSLHHEIFFKAFLMAVIFHPRSYGHLFNPSQRDFFCKRLFLTQACRSEPPGQGVGAPSSY